MVDDKFWLDAEENTPEPSLEGGGSGYFTEPVKTLDPALFNGEKLKPNVRGLILHVLEDFLQLRFNFAAPDKWLHVWLAGSGVSHQWEADRGNGDLDVLYGVDMVAFAEENPSFSGYSEDELAPVVNEILKAQLWPQTAMQDINGKTFELTFFWSPGTGTDIHNIHPYAAYDVTHDDWTVRPDPNQRGPENVDWAARAAQDTRQAREFVSRHNQLRRDVENYPTGTPRYHDATARINLVAAQARALFDDIHLGRREAFGEQGHGYADWANYRWQTAKSTGVVKGLAGILAAAYEARSKSDQELYGGALKSADDLVRRAAMGKRFDR